MFKYPMANVQQSSRVPTGNTFRDMNFIRYSEFLLQTDRRTESDAYDPTVQHAQVGSKMIYLSRTYEFSKCTGLATEATFPTS